MLKPDPFKCRITSCCTRKNYSLRSQFYGEQSVKPVVMRDFVGQITCGAPPIIAIFGTIYLALTNMQSANGFWSKQVRTFEAWDYFVLGSIVLAFLAYAIVAVIGSSFVWLRAASKILGAEEARRIYHRTYQTPRHGYGRKWSIRFVDWILKDA